jgi:hypothetical protein
MMLERHAGKFAILAAIIFAAYLAFVVSAGLQVR